MFFKHFNILYFTLNHHLSAIIIREFQMGSYSFKQIGLTHMQNFVLFMLKSFFYVVKHIAMLENL